MEQQLNNSDGRTEELEEIPVTVPLCSPKIPLN
jgi:hypothetical protein